MNTYLIGFVSEFEDYILILNFEKQFPDDKSATAFSDNSVQSVVVDQNGISIIVGGNTEKLNTKCKYRFKRLIPSHQKVLTLSKNDIDKIRDKMSATDFCSFIFSDQFFLDEERDYVEINISPEQMYKKLCGEYGYAKCFVFSIASFSVNQ